MAFFGTLWGSIGTGGLQGWGDPWLSIAVILVGVALLASGIALILVARRLPAHTESDSGFGKRTGLWFIIVFSVEGIAIGIASAICSALNIFNYFFPIMAIIVGIHFFPLAPLFRVKAHYVTGALLCLLAIITLLFVPTTITIGGHQIIAWWVVVGFGSAFILWATGLGLWWMGQSQVNATLKKA